MTKKFIINMLGSSGKIKNKKSLPLRDDGHFFRASHKVYLIVHCDGNIYLLSTTGTVLGIFKLLKSLSLVVGGVKHSSILAEYTLLWDKGISYLFRNLFFLQTH